MTVTVQLMFLDADAARGHAAALRRADFASVANQIEAALPPPEYPEGTLARVGWSSVPFFAEWKDGHWRSADGSVLVSREVTSVEVIRTLAPDEVAVCVPPNTLDDAAIAREYANRTDREGYTAAAKIIYAFADGLEARALANRLSASGLFTAASVVNGFADGLEAREQGR